MKFEELGLTSEVFKGVQEAGYIECTPIQELVIPHILNGKDVSGLAQTGTGKTAAFVVPLMDRYIRMRNGETGERAAKNWAKNSYNLILVPTRELATQVEEAIQTLGKSAGITSVTVIGGSSYIDQKKLLREGAQFVVGTPGRLLDLYKTHELDLRGVNAVVFDEADRMFDMGFKDDMKFILRRIPRERQFLLFSATLNFEVLNTSYQFGAEPIEFNVSRDQATAEGVEHEIFHLGHHDKPKYLLSLLKRYNPGQCIVFSNFKQNVARISTFLKKNGVEAIEMSSLLSQPQRNKVLEQFKSGEKKVLVATDVAARGLDIKGVDLVINYELPDDAEGYVHRIGRTGRAGSVGKAFGLVSDMDVEALQRIETYLKEKVKVGWMEDQDFITEFSPFPTEYEMDRPNRGPRARPERPTRGPRPDRRPSPPRSAPAAQGQNQSHAPAPEQKSNAVQEDSALPAALRGQHRDRHSRHHSPDRVAAAARVGEAQKPQRGNGEARRGGSNQGRRPQPSQNRHGSAARPAQRSQSSRSQVAQHNHRRPLKKKEAGVGSKIKSFIGKIFGRKAPAKTRS